MDFGFFLDSFETTEGAPKNTHTRKLETLDFLGGPRQHIALLVASRN